MIDDHVKNLDVSKGKTLMFTAGHNKGFDHHKRVDDWKEALAFLKEEIQAER
jgi:5'(3')-deoxyribonucleotidase